MKAKWEKYENRRYVGNSYCDNVLENAITGLSEIKNWIEIHRW